MLTTSTRFHCWDNEIYFILNIIINVMVTHCMWYVCLPWREDILNILSSYKFHKNSWIENRCLVRNKLSLIYWIWLIIIFALPLISHTYNILFHTCSGLMLYYHCIRLVCPVFYFGGFFHFLVFFYTLPTVSWLIISWLSLSTSVSTWMTERSHPTVVLPENLHDSSALGLFPPCGCRWNKRIIM